ncbi:DUF423 domain-containing protein [Ferruginibacter sp. HRS2-29]|uniref:DUF423 domain-containing protein n=1 Tax=Ferruginibacter sp. HRS2-29 TaxID=2487334 RepID=UPI0020CE7E16|nr:DUF423 domain-containing protein [Ferruginibacter sp. HRS2-29]MCP9753275.1 DUF423 domain-containing protein [Ferruginibacter sp. HRS2-29]
MHKGFLKTAALLGALSVILGAFAAHGLKDMVSERSVATFETAVRYQFYHTFALFIAAIVYRDNRSRLVVWAGYLFIAGIVLFSGSLYGLAVVQGMVIPGYKWLGPVTPIGGVAFITGWVLLFLSFWRSK